MTRKPTLLLGTLALVAALVTSALPAGAQGTDPTSSTTTTTAAPTGRQVVKVKARSFAFTPSKLTLPAGTPVTIALTSTDTYHDLVVNGHGVSNKVVVKVSPKKTAKGKLTLTKPGTYDFYCSIQGHRAAGMKGTITVT